jgi:hypothetical protein
MKRMPYTKVRHRLRLAGMSLGPFKVDVLPDNERKIVEEVLTYIEDKGVFHAPYEWEHPKETYEGAAEAREFITGKMMELQRGLPAHGRLQLIREALTAFQRELRELHLQNEPEKGTLTNKQIEEYDSKLVKLRHATGAQVGCLAVMFRLDVAEEMARYLPTPSTS